jgi:RNA polymerase sigma-70 factor (ECF subfamily)
VGGIVSGAECAAIAAGVQAGEASAMRALWRIVGHFRYQIERELGRQDAADRLHDLYLAVVCQIQAGELREPARLIPYIVSVSRFQTYTAIERKQMYRRRSQELSRNLRSSGSAFDDAYRSELSSKLRAMLDGLAPLDREILARFYVLDQTSEHIRSAMRLSPTQYRVRKSRAKLLLLAA